jgi:ligand-binding sensor domain-containing protein/signal transduction histidine kinase/DNA-binding response OmpR family regulator
MIVTKLRDQLTRPLQVAAVLVMAALFGCLPCALGQKLNLKFKHITSTQGLSNNTIESVYQDSRGFLWFGTRDGLNQYDGNKINVFKHSNIPGSLSDNFIRSIYEDKNGTLWIGTADGLNKFNPDNNTFINYKHDAHVKGSISGNDITCVYQDREKNLWVGTADNGLNRYDYISGQFTKLVHQNNSKALPDDEVNCVFEDSRHNLWIGTNKRLAVLDNKTGSLLSPGKAPKEVDFAVKDAVLKIQEDRKGNIWLGTFNNGIVVLDVARHVVKNLRHIDKINSSLSTNEVRGLLVDKKGNVWVGGINGSLDLYNANTGDFEHVQNQPGNAASLSQKTISALYEDNQQNLWVGTHRGGVNYYTPLSEKFQLFQQQSTNNSLSYNDVKAFFEDDQNNMWIGTDGGGLNLYNQAANTFVHFKHNVFDASSISSDAVLSINQDSNNNLWIGTWGGGLNLMNREKRTFSHFTNNTANKTSLSSNYVQATLQDSEHNFWVATYYGGLNLFNLASHSFRRITSDEQQRTSLYGNNIVSLNEDKDKNLWIGTDDGGLNCYNLIKKTFTHYFVNSEKTPDIRVLFTDSKGRVWVGQTGLYLFDKNDRSFKLYTQKGGLATEFIKGITEDDDGNLWISTSNGLTKFNPDTQECKKYNLADGLQELEFEAGAFYKNKKGEMFFGGINGFNKFYPRNIKLNQYVAPLYITGLNIFNKPVLPGQKDSPLVKDISLTHQITLNHTQTALSFEFALLNYTAPDNNQYAYKLEGLEKAWHYNHNDRKAYYTNLDPGHYTFYVKAANNDGIWSNHYAYVDLIILPPFWLTWWFETLAILSILSALYFSLRFKRNLDLQKVEENKREEIHNLQLLFFTNISHEFRTPLSLILGPLEQIMKEDVKLAFKPYYDTIHRNANRLLLLINELMDFRKAESGALKLRVMQGNLNLFIAEIAEDFSNLAVDKQIDFQIITHQEISDTWFDRQLLEKIILNLLGNAFKYTPIGGKITVELYANKSDFVSKYDSKIVINNNFKPKGSVYIRVSDNGIGISRESINHLFERYYRITDAHLGSGVGLAFVKSLVTLHKGSIAVFSERGSGSDFIINIPVDNTDYQPSEKWAISGDTVVTQLESITAPYHHSDHDEDSIDDKLPCKPNHRYTILVVDDNRELRFFLKNILIEYYEVIVAENGVTGLARAREALPDMIISDLIMPEMNGIDFCRHIKTNEQTTHIPFIILTAKDAIESKIEGAGSGADLYFPKPVSINLLLISINNIFQQRAQLKNSYIKNYFVEATEQTDLTKDKQFIQQLTAVIEVELSNAELDVDYICKEMGMSKTKLYHKIKSVTGQSIGEFVRTYRLKKAAYIISNEDVLLTDVMYRVGIQTQSYFTKAFKKEFGKTPSQFLNDNKNRSLKTDS